MSSRTKDPLTELRRIERRMYEMERQMRHEHWVCAAELADRLRKGLTGDEAVKHYNDWMTLHGLSYLTVD